MLKEASPGLMGHLGSTQTGSETSRRRKLEMVETTVFKCGLKGGGASFNANIIRIVRIYTIRGNIFVKSLSMAIAKVNNFYFTFYISLHFYFTLFKH